MQKPAVFIRKHLRYAVLDDSGKQKRKFWTLKVAIAFAIDNGLILMKLNYKD
jgi:hypothetical protein